MAARKKRRFECNVISEVVQIHLRNRSYGGFGGEERPFVQCDQQDCQYVDKNEPPCPLTLSMFADELREREEEQALRRGDAERE